MATQYGKYICASLLVIGLAACAVEDRSTVNKAGSQKPAARIDVAAPKGLSDDVYYDAEVQSLVASLSGMQTTLSRLEGDIQTLAMQRIAAMREEITETNRQLLELQENLRASNLKKADAPIVETKVTKTVVTEVSMVEPVAPEATPAPAPVAVPVTAPTALQSTQKSAPQSTPAATPVATPVVEKATEAPKPAVNAAQGVKDVRVGTHANYVRVVLDVIGKKAEYTAHFDEAEKIVTLELPNTPWNASLQQNFANNPSIASYTAQKTDKGSIVVFTLKDGVKLRDKTWLSGAPSSRLILDFTR